MTSASRALLLFCLTSTACGGSAVQNGSGVAGNPGNAESIGGRGATGPADSGGAPAGGSSQMNVSGGSAGSGGAPAPSTGCSVANSGGVGAAGAPSGSSSSAVAIVSGDNHTCALLADGTVKCWGDNSNGQLGVGAKSCLESSSVPLPVANLSGVIALAAGNLHTCALLYDRTVKCWGEDPARAADTTTPMSFDAGNTNPCPIIASTGATEYVGTSPGPVQCLAGVTALSAGNDADCALLANGSVQCWGDPAYGELGNGMLGGAGLAAPVTATVLNLVGAVNVADGMFSSCAVLSNGQVRCWGANESGELGDGSMTDATLPVTVSNIDNATAVVLNGPAGSPSCATCYGFTCALLSDQTVKCWGESQDGELGSGTTSASVTPVPVSNLTGVRSIAAGPGKMYAVLTDGTIAAWGSNRCGELGNGQTGHELTPIHVPNLKGVLSVAAGQCSTCALGTDGSVECWGAGALGSSSVQTSLVPVPVTL